MEFKVLVIITLVNFFTTCVAESCPKIISREEWGAKQARWATHQIIPVKRVIILSTETLSCANFDECSKLLRFFQKSNIKTNCSDIASNFYITDDGWIYEGVGWLHVGFHTRNNNVDSYGVSFIGDHMEKLPSSSAMRSLISLLACGIEKGKLTQDYQLFGNRQFVTDSNNPGDMLYEYLQIFSHWTNVDSDL